MRSEFWGFLSLGCREMFDDIFRVLQFQRFGCPNRNISQNHAETRRDILMSRDRNCCETIFVSQLSLNYPHHGGNFERGKNALFCRVAQEPNRNRKPEPSEPFFPKPRAEPEPPEPFSRDRGRNRPFLLNCAEIQENPFCRGTAGTENRNRSNRSTTGP